MKRIYIIPLIIVFSVSLFSGCATRRGVTEDEIIKIYAKERDKPKVHPLVFIPGIFGTVLKDGDTGKVIWGSVAEGAIKELALPIDSANIPENTDQVVPVETIREFKVIPGIVEKDIYGRARRIAIKAGGYEMGNTAFSLSYDWRLDLVDGARRLGKLIDEIKKEKANPSLKVDIVCHSAGGLIARYYAKYGTEDVLGRDPIPEPTYKGAANINKIIMLGTPNYGSLDSFRGIDKGITIPGIGRATKDITFTMPSAYELMPAPGKIAFIDSMGNDLDVSLYDPTNWERYGWSVFGEAVKDPELRAKQIKFIAAMLKRAEAFQEALWKGSPEKEAKNVTYILLGADADPTSDKALLEKTSSGWKTRFNPHDDTLYDKAFAPGDNTVTRKSLLGTHIKKGKEEEFPSAYEIFIAQEHVDLPGDPTFLDNVLHSLLDKGKPVAE